MSICTCVLGCGDAGLLWTTHNHAGCTVLWHVTASYEGLRCVVCDPGHSAATLFWHRPTQADGTRLFTLPKVEGRKSKFPTVDEFVNYHVGKKASLPCKLVLSTRFASQSKPKGPSKVTDEGKAAAKAEQERVAAEARARSEKEASDEAAGAAKTEQERLTAVANEPDNQGRGEVEYGSVPLQEPQIPDRLLTTAALEAAYVMSHILCTQRCHPKMYAN